MITGTLYVPCIGATCEFISGSYENNVCDMCGNPRKCDYWQNTNKNPAKDEWIGIDLCRTCSRELKKEQSK